MKKSWQEIWSKRQFIQEQSETILESLIKMDGFDTPLGKMIEADWRDYVNTSIKNLDLKSNETVFEIGCGCGAFVYVLYEKGFHVSGIDFSLPMIEIAKKIMPNKSASFQVCDAIDLEEIKADSIIANHVFHYFSSYEYVSAVLETVMKSDCKVLITALPDIIFKEESEAFRTGALTDQEYKEKYEGLNILYFSKAWILNEVYRLSPKRKVFFLPNNMPKFSQSKFRFDCLIL
jgi:cyclopropane fatty-acyl-phospholipid synthase-like methyltransferase